MANTSFADYHSGSRMPQVFMVAIVFMLYGRAPSESAKALQSYLAIICYHIVKSGFYCRWDALGWR